MSATELALPSLTILGAGSMGRAVLSGLLDPSVRVDGDIRVTNRSREKAAELADTEGVVSLSTEDDSNANRDAVIGAKIVIIAVKPYLVPAVLEEVASALAPGTIVVSVAAGVTVETLESRLPASVSALRAMPNTPAIVGKAVTGLSAGSRSSDADLALVEALFGTVGETLVVPEAQLDALSSISGSGPAYVFYLIEQLTAAAVDKGFTPEQAALLVEGTFAGSTALLSAVEKTPAQLRKQVTSPNGTTERAIAELEKADLKALFVRATDIAVARSRELAAGA